MSLNPQITAAFGQSLLAADPLSAIADWAKMAQAQNRLAESDLKLLSEAFVAENLHPRLVYYALRMACGYEAVPGSERAVHWLNTHQALIAPVLEPDLRTSLLTYTDWSVTATNFIPPESYADAAQFTKHIWADMHSAGAAAAIGGYDHIRPAYGGGLFASGARARTVHMGLDVFLEAGSSVFAPLDAVVHSVAHNAAQFDYGPCVVLEHKVAPEIPGFYTLYGHLSLGSLNLKTGQVLKAGDRLGYIGNFPENGDWPPHLHLQIVLDMLDKQGDFIGSCDPRHRRLWLALCPNANLITGVPEGLFPQVLPAFRCGKNAPIAATGLNGIHYDACGQVVS